VLATLQLAESHLAIEHGGIYVAVPQSTRTDIPRNDEKSIGLYCYLQNLNIFYTLFGIMSHSIFFQHIKHYGKKWDGWANGDCNNTPYFNNAHGSE
jgi:hypothetical protein